MTRSPSDLQLLDLVRQPSDLRLFHLHRAQFDAGFDGDAADVGDDAMAVFEGAAGEPLEGLAGRRHGLVDVGEQAETALIAAARGGARCPLPPPLAGQSPVRPRFGPGFVNVHGNLFAPVFPQSDSGTVLARAAGGG